MQYFWIGLIFTGHVLITFLPVFSDDFGSGGLSAAIFLWALFTAHLIIFIKKINIWLPFAVIPFILAGQTALLSLIFLNSDFFINNFFGGNKEPFFRLEALGYSTVLSTFIIQGLISAAASAGIWIGRRFDRFQIRRAAFDLDELENIYKFRKLFLPEPAPAFYRFRPLFLKGLVLLGMKRHRILGLMHALWIEDAIIIREILVDPDQTEDPDMIRTLIISMIHRPEIVNSNANEVILLLSGNQPEAEISARRIGFREHPWPDENLGKKLEEFIITGNDPWDPFEHVKKAMRIPLSRINN